MSALKDFSGAWHLAPCADSSEVWICSGKPSMSIAKVLLDIPSGNTNAQLIAKAPEMLEIIKRLMPYAETNCINSWRGLELLNAIRDLLYTIEQERIRAERRAGK